ncbi:MAG: Serine/threonine-protein kinase StkP [candidate division BRC1 bacterium ADurb.BinA364]|nr:MAG: Serine/threonine-protein kinase StkP [candidate division BRC1 bacterium ADurb.BinA364]
MGIVYRAMDNELQEVVALKILPDKMMDNPEAVRRFRSEARSARRLSHPNIVRIHDIGEEMGRKYISMEYVDGMDLKRHLRDNGRMPLAKIVSYARQICEALGYAHKIGVVHRDIKPANIMLMSDGTIKITDFGIAKIGESTESTLVGAVIGTPLYMSPEQVQGSSIDHRADLYSLGILLYELYSGKPPFTEGDLAYQHLNAQPAPLKDAPKALEDIIARCLKKQRDERWADAYEMLDALNALDPRK